MEGKSAQVIEAETDEQIRRELEAAFKAYGATDFAGALEHFLVAAERGNADAQYYAGLMFADGQGTKRNFSEAVRWYEKAAAQNHPDALYALARLYALGVGVDLDAAKAVELYERAARAYPPGPERELAEQQRLALLAVLKEEASDSANTARSGG